MPSIWNVDLGRNKAFLPVTVKNVKEIRRFIPQFMLEVKAMARPLIPPGKISLSSSQVTEMKENIIMTPYLKVKLSQPERIYLSP